jgi:hypothetical protein
MSGVKFSESDWDAEMRAAKDELSATMAMINRRDANAARTRAAAVQKFNSVSSDVSRKNSQILDKARNQMMSQVQTEQLRQGLERTQEQARHNKVMEGVSSDKASAKAVESLSKGNAEKKKALVKAADIISSAAKDDSDVKETKYQEAKTVLVTAGIPVKDELFQEKGAWWGINVLEPKDVLITLNKALESGKDQAPTLSEEDKQALEWANANPDAPQAKEIKQRLGQ